jgi:hypothetical protein
MMYIIGIHFILACAYVVYLMAKNLNTKDHEL